MIKSHKSGVTNRGAGGAIAPHFYSVHLKNTGKTHISNLDTSLCSLDETYIEQNIP